MMLKALEGGGAIVEEDTEDGEGGEEEEIAGMKDVETYMGIAKVTEGEIKAEVAIGAC